MKVYSKEICFRKFLKLCFQISNFCAIQPHLIYLIIVLFAALEIHYYLLLQFKIIVYAEWDVGMRKTMDHKSIEMFKYHLICSAHTPFDVI